MKTKILATLSTLILIVPFLSIGQVNPVRIQRAPGTGYLLFADTAGTYRHTQMLAIKVDAGQPSYTPVGDSILYIDTLNKVFYGHISGGWDTLVSLVNYEIIGENGITLEIDSTANQRILKLGGVLAENTTIETTDSQTLKIVTGYPSGEIGTYWNASENSIDGYKVGALSDDAYTIWGRNTIGGKPRIYSSVADGNTESIFDQYYHGIGIGVDSSGQRVSQLVIDSLFARLSREDNFVSTNINNISIWATNPNSDVNIRSTDDFVVEAFDDIDLNASQSIDLESDLVNIRVPDGTGFGIELNADILQIGQGIPQNDTSSFVLTGFRTDLASDTTYYRVAKRSVASILDEFTTNLTEDPNEYKVLVVDDLEDVYYNDLTDEVAQWNEAYTYSQNPTIDLQSVTDNGSTTMNNIDVGEKVLSSGTQVVYRPSSFTGTLVIGDGGNSLSNTAGSEAYYNTFVGIGAGNANTTGSRNTANGYQALYSNTTGFHNTANGYAALYSNTTGFNNTANGYAALLFNTTGFHNTANGYEALYFNTTGSRNTANGYQALYSNTTGTRNTANGYQALYSNTTGTRNTANGNDALRFNTTGFHNIANGNEALYSNTTGTRNTANGYEALLFNTTGFNNTANGYQALYSNITGNSNTANGYQAGRYITGNVPLDTVSNSIFIGANTKALADNTTNEIVIGYNATGLGSNTVVLGNDNITTTALKGDVGIGTTNPSTRLDVNGDIRIRTITNDDTRTRVWVSDADGNLYYRDASTLSGSLATILSSSTDAGANKITNLADPTADQDAATKAYVDDQTSDVGEYSFTTYRARNTTVSTTPTAFFAHNEISTFAHDTTANVTLTFNMTGAQDGAAVKLMVYEDETFVGTLGDFTLATTGSTQFRYLDGVASTYTLVNTPTGTGWLELIYDSTNDEILVFSTF